MPILVDNDDENADWTKIISTSSLLSKSLGYDEKQEHTSVILALKPPQYAAEQVALPGGLAPDDLHVTLVWLGSVDELSHSDLRVVAQKLASALTPFTAKLDGVIRFEEGAVALNVNAPALPEVRQQLVDTLRSLGYEVRDIHGFTPHLTVAYDEQDGKVWEPRLLMEEVEFEDLWLFFGDEQEKFPMISIGDKGIVEGEAEPVASLILSDSIKDLDAVAAAIADRANNKAVDATLVKSAFLEPWLKTVFGTPESNQLQKVTARTFGFPDPPGTEELDINWKLLYPMGEMYNITQDYLKGRGFSEFQTVPVYRPYLPSEARPKQWQKGDEVRIKLLPLTSWSLNKADAVQVAQFLGSQGSPAFVLKTFIPIKSVVSTPQTGIGVPGTSEVVLAGGEYEAVVDERYE